MTLVACTSYASAHKGAITVGPKEYSTAVFIDCAHHKLGYRQAQSESDFSDGRAVIPAGLKQVVKSNCSANGYAINMSNAK